MEKNVCQVLRNKAVLSNFRLTISGTGVEYWEYSRGFLLHSREHAQRSSKDPEISSERRSDNLNTMRNTIRRLVNTNVGKYGYEAVFLTFTYAENQSDVSLAWSDWREFMRKMRLRFGRLHALSVMEFQQRGAVHFHCIFFNLPPDLEQNERVSREIATLWGHGFVDVERIRSAKNVGAYVCSYLDKSANDERLRGKKFYSTTRNLLSPVVLKGDYARDRMLSMLDQGVLKLEAETSYEYGGAPVIYRNYSIEQQNVHDQKCADPFV